MLKITDKKNELKLFTTGIVDITLFVSEKSIHIEPLNY